MGLTLEHVTEGHLIVDELAKESNIPMAVGPSLTFASKFELQNKSWETPGVLAKAGCHVSIITDNSVGKDADLVLSDGCPFEVMTNVKAVLINGAVVSQK